MAETPQEIRDEFAEGFKRRMANLAEASKGTGARVSEIAGGLVKEEVFGIPGLLADLAPVTNIVANPLVAASSPELGQAVDEFAKEYGAVGLAAKAGVELSDDFLDEEGELRPEMAGRLLAPGFLYAKGATLLPELKSGIASYVRRLNNEGFFPPQLQPAGGPSIMRSEMPTDGPRTTVVESRAAGEGSGTGGPRKVQSEKEEMFVSPDNEAVVPTVKDRTDTGTSAFSESGVYSPLRAALENIEIPKGGITAAKLLEKLRGQPRAGTEMRSIGIEGYLKSMGDKKIDEDTFRAAIDAMAPRYKIKTVFDEPMGEYGGVSVTPEPTSHGTMQRQAGSIDNQSNYGVMLFGDDSAQIGGSYMSAPSHGYFDRQLPGFFGHIRFSIQELQDPLYRLPGAGAPSQGSNIPTVRALVVEEIQTDTVKAFNRKDQVEKTNPIPTVDDIIRENPALPREVAEEAQKTAALARQQKLDIALSNKREYGPVEKIAEVMLNADPNYAKLQGMLDDARAVDNAEATLNSPLMQTVDEFLDGGGMGFRGQATYAQNSSAQKVFMVQNDLAFARTEAEAKAMIEAAAPRGSTTKKLPLPKGNVSNLNEAEIYDNTVQELLETWKLERQDAEKTIARQLTKGDSEQSTNPLDKLVRALKSTPKSNVESLVADKMLENMARDAVTNLKLADQENAAARFNAQYSDQLMEAREAIARQEGVTSEAFGYSPLKTTAQDESFVSTLGATARRDSPSLVDDAGNERIFATSITGKDVGKALGVSDDTVMPDLAIRAEETLMRMDALRQLHPALARAVSISKKFTSPKDFQNDVFRVMGQSTGLDEIQQRLFKSSILDELDKAQARAPSAQTLEKGIAATLKDPSTGPAFLSRLGLAERMIGETSPVAVALRNNDMDELARLLSTDARSELAESVTDVYDLANRPPYMNQNDFIQFATRVLPVEAKKMGVDMVVMPPAEEFMAARSASPQDIEALKAVVEQEDAVRRLIQSLRSKVSKAKKKDKDAVVGFESQQELDDLMDQAGLSEVVRAMPVSLRVSVEPSRRAAKSLNEVVGATSMDGYALQNSAEDLIELLGDALPNVSRVVAPRGTGGSSTTREMRGSLQNYGKNLDAALAKLNKSGVKVQEAVNSGAVKFASPQGSQTYLGRYANGAGVPNTPAYKVIDLRDPGTAEVAKKVPSAYKDGGPVDLRPKKLVHSGIGVMARQVM
jgi:hypothetical protein